MPIKYAAGKTASLLGIAASPPTPSRKQEDELDFGLANTGTNLLEEPRHEQR